MNNQSVAARLPVGPNVLTASFVGNKMQRSLQVVMGWQETVLPSRFVIGNGNLRKLSTRVREQPVNFMIILYQSLMTARKGRHVCMEGLKASKVLLGEENHCEQDKADFTRIKVEEIKKSASDLNAHTHGIHEKFRALRVTVLHISNDINEVADKRERSEFVRLVRHLSKGARNCEDALRQVQDDLGQIENSLSLLTSWWQNVQVGAKHLQTNGESRLVDGKNVATLKDIKDSFQTLDEYFADYTEQMFRLYDENVVNLNTENQKYLENVRDCASLVLSSKGRWEPRAK